MPRNVEPGGLPCAAPRDSYLDIVSFPSLSLGFTGGTQAGSNRLPTRIALFQHLPDVFADGLLTVAFDERHGYSFKNSLVPSMAD